MMKSKRNSRKGAQIVEASLIATALFGLTFLLLDVSMAVFLKSTFQHAVREGVRLGVTGYTNGGTCQDDTIKAAVKRNAIGFLSSPSAASKIHVHFMSPVNGAVTDNAPGNIIEVSVEGYQYTPLALFQRTGAPQITARAYDVMEPYPGNRPCITVAE
jgi:Flp pilus assembly protein TadG